MQKIIAVLALAVAACGGASGSSSNGNLAKVEQLNTLAQDVSTTATTYGTQAGGMTDGTTCTGDETTYDGQVRPMIDEMQAMGPAMDQMMGSLGRSGDADMSCAAAAMMAELDRHRAAACASTTDMGPNMTEAQQHVAAMKGWADHQLVRSYDMGTMMGSGTGSGMGGGMGGGGMGGGGMGGGGMATGHCVRNQDGTYTLQP
jgi:hypothetical protein